jgi:hypothetical protein
VESSRGGDQRVEIAMMRMPDGHGRLELSRFLTPPAVADHRNAPVNALGYLRVMFAVDDIDETLERLRKHGAQLVGEVVPYKDAYRLCYIRALKGFSSDSPKSSDEGNTNTSEKPPLSATEWIVSTPEVRVKIPTLPLKTREGWGSPGFWIVDNPELNEKGTRSWGLLHRW